MKKNRTKYRNNYSNFFLDKKNLIQKLKYFKNNLSKSFILIDLLLLVIFKLNIALSQSINKKRYLISQPSLIKLKIEKSGNHKVYASKNYDWCESIIIPNEISINEEIQTQVKSEYNFVRTNNEIILKWNNPLNTTSCLFRDCTSITEIDLSNFDDSQLVKMQTMFF